MGSARCGYIECGRASWQLQETILTATEAHRPSALGVNFKQSVTDGAPDGRQHYSMVAAADAAADDEISVLCVHLGLSIRVSAGVIATLSYLLLSAKLHKAYMNTGYAHVVQHH